MKRIQLCLLGFVLLAAFATAGCFTSRQFLALQDEPLKSAEAEDLILTVRFLDDATLKDKFGENSNPFLTDYFSVQLKRIMVFEITLENRRSESVGLVSKRLELQFGGNSRSPYNRFQLTNYWDTKDEEQNTKNIYRTRKKGVINDWVLPNELTVAPGGKARGYVVFLGNFPSYGTAGLYVPVLQAREQAIHRFELTFSF